MRWLTALSAILVQLYRLYWFVDVLYGDCEVKTTTGACCVFPFTAYTLTRRSCYTLWPGAGDTLWCATTSNYDTDGQWGACDVSQSQQPKTDCSVKTTTGECCVFPFKYYGQLIKSCISDNNENKLWCSTTGDYDADLKWGDCDMTQHPYRWVLTHGRKARQSSKFSIYDARYATDGDYNHNFANIYFSETTESDLPYLQVDMGRKMTADIVIMKFPMVFHPAKIYKSIRVTVADTDTAYQQYLSADHCYGTFHVSGARFIICSKKGRYLTVQSYANGVILSIVEIAVHRRPIESVALNKPATQSSAYGPSDLVSRTVDMNFRSHFRLNQEFQPWIRVDLEELYYIREVVIWLRHDCCTSTRADVEVRAGRSPVNNGNSNHVCGNHTFYMFEIRSFYCKVFGRYVSVRRLEEWNVIMAIGEIVVNPETTDNVALGSTNSANIAVYSPYVPVFRVTDGDHASCHIMIESTEPVKTITITMDATYDIYKIFIINNQTKLDSLVEFEILVGELEDTASLCLPGMQSMAGVHTKAFYCEPRVSGSKLFIRQKTTEKTMSICEVAAYTETKPEIDRSKDHYIWVEENTNQLSLTCEAKGYPTPVLSWVRNYESVQSESSTLELTALGANHSGEYECWANNTHGSDVKVVDVVVTSDLRICADFEEVQFKVGKSESEEFKFRGNQWYSFYDPNNRQSLQLYESYPRKSPCHLWLDGTHPKIHNGVVSRTLCLKSGCSTTYDVFVRRCTGSYIYNFKDIKKISSWMTFCFRNAKNLRDGLNPGIASPSYGFALLGSVFRTETDVEDSTKCFLMCQVSPTCKSYNFSMKEKICELNSATKKESPQNYVGRSHYNYYHLSKGMVVSQRRGEL